jgi:hypothetical protein
MCISIYACNETNLMHYLSSVYLVILPLHASGLLVSHHQEVTMYICDNFSKTRTNSRIHTLLPPYDGQLSSWKHEV